MHNGNWHDGMGYGNGSWILMMVMMVAFWGGLIWLGVTLLKRTHHATALPVPASPATTPKPSAQEILAERLARGDIDPEDYRQRLDALRANLSGPTESATNDQ